MLIVIMFLLIVGQGILAAGACAAEQASKAAAKDMKKQHQTMLTVGAQWNKAKQALAKGDFQSAEPAVTKLIDAAPNVEKFQPHRNPEKREQLIEYGRAFVASLDQLKSAVATRNVAATDELIKAVDKTCSQCHTAFGGGHQHSPKSKGR